MNRWLSELLGVYSRQRKYIRTLTTLLVISVGLNVVLLLTLLRCLF